MSSVPKHSAMVVRTYAPARRALTVICVTLLSAFTLYVIYELGRYDAGYDRLAVSQERAELHVVIERLEKANRELRTQFAALDTIRIGRAREQAEVSRAIGDLQAQVARQTQELAFYRGIVAQSAVSLGVKIQQLRVLATDKPARFHVHFTLVRSVRPDDVVSGTLVLALEGEGAGQEGSVDLTTLTSGKQRELPFNFRYFENFDQEIAIPRGVRPERLTVELRSSRKGVSPLTQTFLWSVDAS